MRAAWAPICRSDPGRRSRGRVPAPRLGDSFHCGQHDAHMELGHGELLVADCVCVYRPGAGFLHGRGSARSAQDAAARGLRRGRADCSHVHRRNLCRAGARSRRRHRSARAASFMPSPWGRRTEHWVPGSAGGCSGHCGQRRRRGIDCGRRRARAVPGWASIAICPRPSARFIPSGRRRTFPFSSRPCYPPQFCS